MPDRDHSDRAREAFICYSRAEIEDGERLFQQLLRRYGILCWMDHRGIPAASDFESTISEAIQSSSSFLLLFGKNGLTQYQRDVELPLARKRNLETDGKYKIIPVVIPGGDPADLSKEGFDPSLQYADYRTSSSAVDALWAIATAIRPGLPHPDVDALRVAQTIETAHRLWEQSKRRDRSFFLRRSELKRAKELQSERPEWLAPDSHVFIQASEEEERRLL